MLLLPISFFVISLCISTKLLALYFADEKFMGVSSKITRLFSVSEKKEILRIPSDVVCHYLKLAPLSPC